jgi:hypothetical protein
MDTHLNTLPRPLVPTYARRAILAALLLSAGGGVLGDPATAPSMAEDQRMLIDAVDEVLRELHTGARP